MYCVRSQQATCDFDLYKAYIFIVVPNSRGYIQAFTMSVQQLQNVTSTQILDRSTNSLPTNISTNAKVVSIYDGDTCDLVIIRNGSLERFKSRLLGIDTPEIKTGGTQALKARDFLAWLSISNDPTSFSKISAPWSDDELQLKLDANKTLIYAEFQGIGGHGRPLVTLRKYQGAKDSFNDLLMQYGYAEKYRG